MSNYKHRHVIMKVDILLRVHIISSIRHHRSSALQDVCWWSPLTAAFTIVAKTL